MGNDHHAHLHLVWVPLFEGLMLRADEDERSALRLIAHEKPRRDDIRAHPRPSRAVQLLDFFESMAICDIDPKGRAQARAEAERIRSWIASHEMVEDDHDPYVQFKRGVSAIDAIFAGIVDDQNVPFSGILYDDQLPKRRVILPELVRDATVFWCGDDNACLRCSTPTCIYCFQHVKVAISNQTASRPSNRAIRNIPAEVLDGRMHRMSELVQKHGMKRQTAARQVIREMPYRDQSEQAAVKRLMREWNATVPDGQLPSRPVARPK